MSTKGTILKNRIKQMGYTQERFAEEYGISPKALRNYMNDKVENGYGIEHLEKFAEKLDCTYDYLLGKSEVPEREHQDIRNETGLSICAVEELKEYKRIGKIDIISYIFEQRNLLEEIVLYMDEQQLIKTIFEASKNSMLEEYGLDEHDIRVGKLLDFDFNFLQSIILELKVAKEDYKKS